MSLPDQQQLRALLTQLYPNPQQLERAVAGLHSLGLDTAEAAAVASGEHDIDLLRRQRCGFPEVIYGEGKSADQIIRIMEQLQKAEQDILVTRLNPQSAATIMQGYPRSVHNESGRTIRLMSGSDGIRECGEVVVITAGSTDRAVADEACETLRWMRVPVTLLADAGVAGPHRLLQHLPRLQQAAAIVCIAGMEAALPSVVGGYVACPVIGVPTSVGYGASLGGLTAMLSMLTCCSSNVVCVNVDAGFKGGYTAGLIASRVRQSARIQPLQQGPQQ